jgi:hypothetical protein
MIEMPALAYRFRVRVSGDDDFRFTKQVVKSDIDHVNNTIAITVRQPENDNEFHLFINRLCKHGVTIAVDHMNGNGAAASTIELFPATAESHKFSLNYGDIEVAVHELVFKFTGISNPPIGANND